jgi:hypothetical protein
MRALYIRTTRPEMVPGHLDLLRAAGCDDITVLSTRRDGLEFPGCRVVLVDGDYSRSMARLTGRDYHLVVWGAYRSPGWLGMDNVIRLAVRTGVGYRAIVGGNLEAVDAVAVLRRQRLLRIVAATMWIAILIRVARRVLW